MPDHKGDEKINLHKWKLVGGFCTYISGDANRRYACKMLGKEWGNATASWNCHYSSCDKKTAVHAGLHNGCLGIHGAGVKCQRLSFLGDPLKCCFNNCSCQKNIGNKCFSDSKKEKTCSYPSPNYRNIYEKDCRQILEDYCLGTELDKNDLSWLNRWGFDFENSCTRTILKLVNKNTCEDEKLKNFEYSQERLLWAQNILFKVYQKYREQGFELNSKKSSLEFQRPNIFLYHICKKHPLVCNYFLEDFCKSKTLEQSRADIDLMMWCGCYLPENQYKKFTDIYKITKECTPICNNTLAINNTNYNSEITCKDSICLIDNISYSTINTKIEGDVQFNQICNNCVGGKCTCMIERAEIISKNSHIGGNQIPIDQLCNSKISKIKTNDGQILSFPDVNNDLYTTYLKIDNILKKKNSTDKFTNTCIIFIFIIILLIVLIIGRILI